MRRPQILDSLVGGAGEQSLTPAAEAMPGLFTPQTRTAAPCREGGQAQKLMCDPTAEPDVGSPLVFVVRSALGLPGSACSASGGWGAPSGPLRPPEELPPAPLPLSRAPGTGEGVAAL